MFQTFRVQVEEKLADGAYTLTLALEPPDGGPAPIRSDAGAWAGIGTELELGRLTVR